MSPGTVRHRKSIQMSLKGIINVITIQYYPECDATSSATPAFNTYPHV